MLIRLATAFYLFALIAVASSAAKAQHKPSLAASPAYTCPQNANIVCNNPTPSPSPKPATVENGLADERPFTSGTTADLVITQGQSGELSFTCAETPGNYACPSSAQETWNITSDPGISTSVSPTITAGSQPTTATFTASTVVAPNIYSFTICFDSETIPGQCKAVNVQVVAGAAGTTGATTLGKAIANEAISFYNQKYDTSAGNACYPGGPGGACACAWVVNVIFSTLGIRELGANTVWVPSLEADLKAGRGKLIPTSQALPGDLVIENHQGHIGICITAGCTVVYSNSTKYHEFINSTGPNMFELGAPPRVYRLLTS